MKQITKNTVLKQGDKSFEQFLAENPYKHTRSFTEADWEADMYEKWKETIKTYTAIETEQGIVWVDKDAKIKQGDWYIDFSLDKPSLYQMKYKQWGEEGHLNCKKIIAANFYLEGVPKIELEDDEVYTIEDVKESSIHFCDAYINSPSTVENKDLREVWELFKNSCVSWIKNRRIKKDYKANQAKYTEKDMKNAFKSAREGYYEHSGDRPPAHINKWITAQDYLQSLKSIKKITVDENFKTKKN